MSSKSKVIVSVSNDLFSDNRVDKICDFILEQGYEVTLIGRRKKDSLALKPRKYQTKRFKLLFEKGPLFYAALNFRIFFYLIFHKADIFVSNDLDTLLANYLASKCKRKVKLVYDSHEFFTEVPELQGRKAKVVWEKIERWIFPKLNNIYTVNQSIANEYKKKYSKELSVVRNISPLWKAEHKKSKKELGLHENQFIVIMQGAGINVNRGAEEAVQAIQKIDDAVLVFVGDGDAIPQLKKEVKSKNLEHKVLFFGKRPYDEMMQFTHLSDIGLSLDHDTNLNYLYSLPNKIFDYLHAQTPFICTNLPEVAKIANETQAGIVIKKLEVDELVKAIVSVKSDLEKQNFLKEKCIEATKTLNWEFEKIQLSHFYPKING